MNRSWSFLIVFRFQNKQKGIAIALVLVGLMVGMGVVMLYLSTVRSQRKFDVLYEQDLRAYYLSESGFQYTIGKLHESPRYEERWYQPSLNVSLRKQFRYTGQAGYGAFQTYLTQIDENQKFSHLFLLSKGVFYTGKTSREGGREKVIAIIKGNLGYSPTPPSDKQQALFVIAKSPLNQAHLLEFISEPKFRHLFTVDNGVIPSKIRSLLEFLKTNRVEDIDFPSEPALMQGIAQLDYLNQKIRNLKRLSVAINANETLGGYPSFPTQPPKHKPISFLSEVKLKLFNQLISSGQNIDQLNAAFSKEIKPLTDKRKASLLSKESLNLLKYLPPQTKVELDAKQENLVESSENLSIDQFRNLIMDKSADFELLRTLLKSKTIIKPPITSSFKLRDISDVAGLSKTLKILGSSTDSDQIADEAQADSSTEAKPEGGQLPKSDQPDIIQEGHFELLKDRTEADILNSEDPFDSEGRVNILEHLYHPMFDNVSLDEPLYDENLANGFLKIFLSSLEGQLHEFTLATQVLLERDPTPEEYLQFASENPIPSRTTIIKIGNILDDLFSSTDYSFHYGANVLRSNSYNTAGGIYTVVERKPETMHIELQNKLTTYYFTHGATSDKQFLEMFKKSTWGDSSSANAISKNEEFHSSKHKTDYFIRHKTTGEEIKLFDYLNNRL